jgi:GTP cyclohydrolase IB
MKQTHKAEAPPGQPADVQGEADPRRVPIDRVGVRGLRHPLQIEDRSGYRQGTVAELSMTVALAHEAKGAHMSRFVEMINELSEPLSVHSFRRMLEAMTDRLDARDGEIEIRFPYFRRKYAPVSGVASLMDYQAAFIGRRRQGHNEIWLKVAAPATSLCPCSKRISDYGAHNQRSEITIEARVEDIIWLEELIEIAEGAASAEVYGVLKRPDEKYVTEQAYDNPKFVEDMIRDLAIALDDDERIRAYRVCCENFESIHNHSAFAELARDKDKASP